MAYNGPLPLVIKAGGTDASSMTNTDGVVYFDGTRLVTTAVGTATQVLTSNGAGVAPTFQASGGGGVPSIAGTTNQITEAGSPGATTLSIPSTFIAPGSIEATSTITADTGLTVIAGDITQTATTGGNINLAECTASSAGVINAWDYISGSWTKKNFIHNYGADISRNRLGYNTFIGYNAGNFTLTVGTAQANTAIGAGGSNFGNLLKLTTGAYNSSFGSASLIDLTTGSGNTGFGAYSLEQLTTGSNNTAIGSYNGTGAAGINYTSSESNNVMINNYGTVSESNVLRIGTGTGTGTWQLNKAFISGIYNTAVGATAGVVLSDSTDQLGGLAGASSTVLVGGTKPSFTGSPSVSGSITAGTSITATAGDITLTAGNVNLSQAPSASQGGITAYEYVSGSWTQNRFIHNYGGDSSGNKVGDNTFVGYNAGNFSLTVGTSRFNTGVGGANPKGALGSLTTGTQNAAFGATAATAITTGTSNLAIGATALNNLTTGSYNTCLGSSDSVNGGAGYNLTSSETNNVLINNGGVTGHSHELRIGGATGNTNTWDINAAYICGIQGITVTGTAVLISSSDQLGIAISSRRYKENISEMDAYSSDILKLRPVTFNYTVGQDHSLQSGLIAEEVAQIMPALVVNDREGLPQTVKYHDLPVLLLNELQKQDKIIKSYAEMLDNAFQRISLLEAKLSILEGE
jgi:hypothetical protein